MSSPFLTALSPDFICFIITNSSYEVFIDRNLKSKNQEIIELIQNVAKAANLDLDEILEFEIGRL